MADSFEQYRAGLESPGESHYDAGALASDTVDLTPKPRALRFNAAGIVVLKDKAGLSLTYTVAAGEVMPFRFTRLMATGTDAAIKAANATIAWY